MNSFGDVFRDHGIGLGKYKIGGNIGSENLEMPYAMFTFGPENFDIGQVDSQGNIYLYGNIGGSSAFNSMAKYSPKLTSTWLLDVKPASASNQRILKVILDRNDNPWCVISYQRYPTNYIGIYRVNKATGAIEHGIEYVLGTDGNSDPTRWNFAVDLLTDDVVYVAREAATGGKIDITRVSVPSKTVAWTYSNTPSYTRMLNIVAHTNGSVYISDQAGWVYRLNTSNGEEIFKRETSKNGAINNPLDAMAVDDAGNVYVGGGVDLVSSFSPSGVLRWEYQFGFDISSLAVSIDGTKLYISTIDSGYVGRDVFDVISTSNKLHLKRLRVAGPKRSLRCAPNGDIYMYTTGNIGTPICIRQVFKIIS